MAEEWDVFQMLPGDDAPVLLATLYEASQKSIRVELNGPGSGSFAINRTSPECTEAILAQGNLVKVRIPEIHTDYIFAFFLETGDFTLISSQEAGGETLTFGGRGILSYLEYACAWSESYIVGGDDPEAGVWRAYNAGTGSAPGQILRRLIEEFQDPDRPQEPLPHLTIDFDYDDDSTADPWDTTDATDEFAYQVGEDGMAITQRLIDTEAITVQMDPDFLLHAYNVANFGRALAGDAFGADVVRFVRGTNIATELRRELAVLEVKTHMLAGGEADKYGSAALADAATRVTKEGFIAAFGTGTTALDGVAAAELADRLHKSDMIQFPIANRRTADVVLSDPVSIGAPLGPVATAGSYLPGPEGTNGDFWVGDTVRVFTGLGPFDYGESDWRVEAITITRDDDNAELIVIPELVSGLSVVPCSAESIDPFFDEERRPVESSFESFAIPAAPDGLPYAIVALVNVESAFISVGPYVTIDTSGDWNDIGDFSVAWGEGWHDVVRVGYNAQPAGTPETFDATLAFVQGTLYYTDWCLAAVAIATSDTAPVQYAQSVGPNPSAVTLPGAPTPGNILVMMETMREDIDTAPTGWTTLADIPHGGGGGIGGDPSDFSHIYVWGICVPEGMSATITMQAAIVSRERHMFVSEWTPA